MFRISLAAVLIASFSSCGPNSNSTDNFVARQLYENLGFKITGKLPAYYPSQGSEKSEFTVDALIMHHEPLD
jgi:hypothetical protein